MSELLTWLRVPNGAALEVSLEPLDGQFTATGQVFRFKAGNPPDEDWTDADLRPGPKRLALKASTDYIVDVLVQFVGTVSSAATVRAAVVKGDGSPHGKRRTVTLRGKNGDPPDTVSILLVTTKSR
jgi:hypothetical protein